MKPNYQIGQELEVKIEKIVPRGLGLAFAEGLTVFVPLSAGGDRLRVRIEEIKGKTAFAEVTEILEPSDQRTSPPCPYFGVCGGCDLMHLEYGRQLDAKVAMIRDCIERIGKIDYPSEIAVVASPQQFGYRLRAQWHGEPHDDRLGYYRRNSRDPVDIEDCIVLVPELREELRRQRAVHEPTSQRFQIDAAAGTKGDVSVSSSIDRSAAPVISVTAAAEELSFSANTFFQGNRFLVDRLVEIAIGDAAGETALDLYCGVGLFTLPLARRFANVIGVEESERSIEFANANAERAGLSNIELYSASVRDFLASGESPKADFVLLDPPRAGTERDTIMNVIGLRPRRVSYVACEPSILARDLKRFVENGYRIDSITAIDLFPQTHHVETVAHLSSYE